MDFYTIPPQKREENSRPRPTRLKMLLITCYLAGMSNMAFSDQAGLSNPSPPDLQQLSNPEWIAEGREKFVQVCAYCHGQEGDSGKVRPFRERQNWDPVIIHDTISEGRQRGANIMPSWKESIPDDMIWKLVAYIRSLEGKPR